MLLFDYLFYLFIEPLKLIFEAVFFCAYYFSHNIALSIVAISIVINLLVLPLYKHADELEDQQREKKRKMKLQLQRTLKTPTSRLFSMLGVEWEFPPKQYLQAILQML